MKAFLVFSALAAVASAGLIAPTTLLRTPALDSAVIKSDRLGGNFAYSSIEGHAYTAYRPIVQNLVSPVATTYSAHPYYPANLYAPTVYHTSVVPGEGAVIAPVAPVAPGIIAPAVPGFIPTDFVSGIFPSAPAQPAVEAADGEKPAEQPAAEVAPGAETPVVQNEEQPAQTAETVQEPSQPTDDGSYQSDDSDAVSVDSV